MSTVFVFAHQDDEVFILPRIQYELSENNEVHCFYLTSGGFRRCQESISLLTAIGVKKINIHFIGDHFAIPDGHLIDNLDLAFKSLVDNPAISRSTLFFVPAWEGGHHDHDACTIIAQALSKKFAENNIKIYQFFLYNGEGLRWKFFKVMSPLSTNKTLVKSRTITLRNGITALLAMRYFPSQLTTWIGLAPGAFVHFLFKRVEVLMPLTLETTRHRPHEGPLLYERYGRTTYENVSSKYEIFIRSHPKTG